MIDRSLSAAFDQGLDDDDDDDDDDGGGGDGESSNERSTEPTSSLTLVAENHFAISESKSDSGLSKQDSIPDFDYSGYTRNGDSGFLTSNTSDQNLARSDSSTPSSTTQEQWSYLKPIDSPGDFEKELLSIRSRYDDRPRDDSTRNNNSDTALEDLPMHASCFNRSGDNNDSAHAIDPLLEHFT